MSKPVKELITKELHARWQGVNDILLVDVAPLEANANVSLRKSLREKNIQMMVVKNSLARRACEGSPLQAAFDGVAGTTAVVWGAEDIVSLAKEVTKLAETKEFSAMTPKGGVMDGAQLSADDVKKVSKWPSRTEQLSLLMGQILSPGSTLSGQLVATARGLASQIEQLSKEKEPSA
jgi:large subunit ribosomal protein L10